MFSKVMLVAAVTIGEFSHVLIRRPFVVPVRMLSLTMSPRTSLSWSFLPRLPTLPMTSGHDVKAERERVVVVLVIRIEPDTVPRSTGDAGEGHVGISMAYGDAVVPRANKRFVDGHARVAL